MKPILLLFALCLALALLASILGIRPERNETTVHVPVSAANKVDETNALGSDFVSRTTVTPPHNEKEIVILVRSQSFNQAIYNATAWLEKDGVRVNDAIRISPGRLVLPLSGNSGNNILHVQAPGFKLHSEKFRDSDQGEKIVHLLPQHLLNGEVRLVDGGQVPTGVVIVAWPLTHELDWRDFDFVEDSNLFRSNLMSDGTFNLAVPDNETSYLLAAGTPGLISDRPVPGRVGSRALIEISPVFGLDVRLTGPEGLAPIVNSDLFFTYTHTTWSVSEVSSPFQGPSPLLRLCGVSLEASPDTPRSRGGLKVLVGRDSLLETLDSTWLLNIPGYEEMNVEMPITRIRGEILVATLPMEPAADCWTTINIVVQRPLLSNPDKQNPNPLSGQKGLVLLTPESGDLGKQIQFLLPSLQAKSTQIPKVPCGTYEIQLVTLNQLFESKVQNVFLGPEENAIIFDLESLAAVVFDIKGSEPVESLPRAYLVQRVGSERPFFGRIKQFPLLIDDLPEGDYEIFFGSSSARIVTTLQDGGELRRTTFFVSNGGLLQEVLPAVEM